MDTILEKILNLIGKKHGAQKELADFLGISSNNITDWKSGRNKSYRLYLPQIAEHYNVSLDWLSGLTGEKEKPATINDDELSELDKLFLSLSAKHRETALEHLRFLADQEVKNK